MKSSPGYSYRKSGMAGCELLNLDGKVFAWTLDEYWAVLIVALLNLNKSE